MGPKGKNPHGIDEYVEVDSVLQLIKIMVLTAIDYCSSNLLFDWEDKKC